MVALAQVSELEVVHILELEVVRDGVEHCYLRASTSELSAEEDEFFVPKWKLSVLAAFMTLFNN